MCSTAVATMVPHGAQPTMAMMTFSRGHNGFSHRLPLFPLGLWLSPLTTALPDGGFFSSIATIRLPAVGWGPWLFCGGTSGLPAACDDGFPLVAPLTKKNTKKGAERNHARMKRAIGETDVYFYYYYPLSSQISPLGFANNCMLNMLDILQ